MSMARSASTTRPVVCYHCRAPSWPTNRVWFDCDVCGRRVWLDFDHPEAPPRFYARRTRRGGTT